MFAWFSTLWGKIALFVAAALALFVGKKIYDHGKRQEGREDERQDRLQDHVEAIEEGRKAEADTDSPRAQRLRSKYRRD